MQQPRCPRCNSTKVTDLNDQPYYYCLGCFNTVVIGEVLPLLRDPTFKRKQKEAEQLSPPEERNWGPYLAQMKEARVKVRG